MRKQIFLTTCALSLCVGYANAARVFVNGADTSASSGGGGGGGSVTQALNSVLTTGGDGGDQPMYDVDWYGGGNGSSEANFTGMTNEGAHLFLKETGADYSLAISNLVGTSEEFPDVLIFGGDAKIMGISTNEGGHGTMIDFGLHGASDNGELLKWTIGMHTTNHTANPASFFWKYMDSDTTGGVASVNSDYMTLDTNGNLSVIGGLDLSGEENQMGQYMHVGTRGNNAANAHTGKHTVAMFQEGEGSVVIVGDGSSGGRGARLLIGGAASATSNDMWQFEALGPNNGNALSIGPVITISNDFRYFDLALDSYLTLSRASGVTVSNGLTVSGGLTMDTVNNSASQSGLWDIDTGSTNYAVHIEGTNDQQMVRMGNGIIFLEVGALNTANGFVPRFGLNDGSWVKTPYTFKTLTTGEVAVSSDNTVNRDESLDTHLVDGYLYKGNYTFFVSGSLGDLRIAFYGTNNSTRTWMDIKRQGATGNYWGPAQIVNAAGAGGTTWDLLTLDANTIHSINMNVLINVTNGNDTLTMEWSQVNSNASNTTIHVGSHLELDVVGAAY